jgi:hypothetical protein
MRSGVCNLPECYVALRIPDGLSDMSFNRLCAWIEATVAHAKKRRELGYTGPEGLGPKLVASGPSGTQTLGPKLLG